MILQPYQFEVGDVVATNLGPARLQKQLEDKAGDAVWEVHYTGLDIELPHKFEDKDHLIIEVVS